MSEIVLSVVVPILNEEKYIEECVRSLLLQQYPMEQVEILLVDGNSTDNTLEICNRLQEEYPQTIKVLNNPKRTQSCAMNIGTEKASGKYIMRVDTHSKYSDLYFKTCIELLETKGAENVGCNLITEAKTKRGKLIAKMLSSSFAVGGSSFRVGAKSDYVETVPFGTFRKEYLQEIGGFDERLDRSEDNEINYRITKRGDKIYMTTDIQTTYYCRETAKGLAKMAYDNGKWNVIAEKFCPGSISVKYFVPLAFVLSLIILPILCFICPYFLILLGLELLGYFGLAALSSLSQTKKISEVIRMLWLYPVFHVPYGVGTLAGVWSVLFKKSGR